MKSSLLLFAAILPLKGFAETADSTIAQHHTLEEVVVRGFKQDNLSKAPLSVSVAGSTFLQRNELNGLRDMSSVFPNLFIADYGARQNTPIYIRGIGSKTNAPSVGLYVDGMPYFERSVVDMDIAGISGIEVLRGPQGTLYGRNSTGGLINIYTYSPLDYQNTMAKISYGSRNDLRLGVNHYQKISSRLGINVAANYHHNDGFFRNLYTGEKADNLQSANAKVGLAWQVTPLWTMRLNALFDHSTQGGYPYGLYHATDNTADAVNYNRPSYYRRNLFTAGMNWLYKGNAVHFNSQTSVQLSKDKQQIDQDFTPRDLFFTITGLKQTLVSQEFTLRSAKDNSRYHWMVGAFGFYQRLNNAIETQFFTPNYATPKFYHNPTWGGAFYHQSAYDVTKTLRVAVGLRYDYERVAQDYEANKYTLTTGWSSLVRTAAFNDHTHFSQITPKFTISQQLSTDKMVYASVARGYKAGGYNVTSTTTTLPAYDPEYNWNYEIGAKLAFLQGRLQTEMSLFYIDWKHQQVTTTVPGLGNIINNAGHSDSKGFELSATYRPLMGLELQANYGYTYARFLRYEKSATVHFTGNMLPMVPRQTMAFAANYTLFHVMGLDKLMLNASLTGTGKIYWTEDNQLKQPFYALLNLKIAATKGRFTWELWSKNTTNTHYMSYAFASSATYAQRGKPFMMGTSILFKLNP
ncbi:MAG: TonB-dependent receptor [Prevotella sp.]|nr:TonB-dependent receptor [Prevotella sp.]